MNFYYEIEHRIFRRWGTMRTNILLAALAIYAVSMGNAFAYLDPGTGSIIVQGVIGAIAGGLVVGRMYWAKFKAFFTRNKSASPSSLSTDRSK
jgi:hypothetical protein